jgi:phosphonate transport system permease protein
MTPFWLTSTAWTAMMSFERRINLPPGSPLESMRTGGIIVLALMLAGWLALIHLGLTPAGLAPGPGGLDLAREFFGRALTPALAFEGEYDGGRMAVPKQALVAAWQTVKFAATALSLALVGGLILGLLGSTAVSRDPRWRLVVGPVRLLTALMRSVHELIWAVLLLAALGTDPLVAVVAIALPYAGTLAKVFSEMLDETPRSAFTALEWAGANTLQRFCFGLLPWAMPDMAAYTFYRFECALRSSAVLGFFGFPTLGYYLAASFENLHYGEVWTYLYTLFLLVLAADWWSGRLRREVLR